MSSEYTSAFTEEERAARRAERAAARKKKLQARRRRQFIQLFPFFLLAVILIVLTTAWATHKEDTPEEESPVTEAPVPAAPVEVEPEEPDLPYAVEPSAETIQLGEDFPSTYAVVVDLANDAILAEKGSKTIISPASMTKILTLLVAAEQITDLNATYSMNIEITDYCYVNDCSVVGYEIDETATMRELLHGVILPSGADACLAVANHVAGSHEAFVELMNQKLEELGLSDTAHFTNCVGLYDENHYCTVYDMAMILKAAMENELCREILDARTYETAPTVAHPEGQILSNWFLRRIEDKDTGDIEVIAAKTGYVTQAGSCAASCGRDADGNEYICVTADADSSWRAIYDHVNLYSTYCN